MLRAVRASAFRLSQDRMPGGIPNHMVTSQVYKVSIPVFCNVLVAALPLNTGIFFRIINLAEIPTNCPTVSANNDPARAVDVHFVVAPGIALGLDWKDDHHFSIRRTRRDTPHVFEGLTVGYLVVISWRGEIGRDNPSHVKELGPGDIVFQEARVMQDLRRRSISPLARSHSQPVQGILKAWHTFETIVDVSRVHPTIYIDHLLPCWKFLNCTRQLHWTNSAKYSTCSAPLPWQCPCPDSKYIFRHYTLQVTFKDFVVLSVVDLSISGDEVPGFHDSSVGRHLRCRQRAFVQQQEMSWALCLQPFRTSSAMVPAVGPKRYAQIALAELGAIEGIFEAHTILRSIPALQKRGNPLAKHTP